jgi:hypothetical protein
MRLHVFILGVTILVLMVLVLTGCTGSETPSSLTSAPASTTSTPSLTNKVPASSPPIPTEMTIPASSAPLTTNEGPLLADKTLLYGKWVLIEQVNKIGEMTQTRKCETSGPNADIYAFDQITARVTHGGSTIYSGDWDLKDGLFTMDDHATNSRPIKYTDMRLKDGILSATFTDRTITQNMRWQKISP